MKRDTRRKTLKVIVMTRASQKEKEDRNDYLSTMGFHGGTQYAQVKEFSPSIQDNNIDRYLISPGK